MGLIQWIFVAGAAKWRRNRPWLLGGLGLAALAYYFVENIMWVFLVIERALYLAPAFVAVHSKEVLVACAIDAKPMRGATGAGMSDFVFLARDAAFVDFLFELLKSLGGDGVGGSCLVCLSIFYHNHRVAADIIHPCALVGWWKRPRVVFVDKGFCLRQNVL